MRNYPDDFSKDTKIFGRPLLVGIFLGILFASIFLAASVTLYLTDKSKKISASETITTTTTTTTSPSIPKMFWSFDSHCDELNEGYHCYTVNNASFRSPGYTGFGAALSLNGSQYALVSNHLKIPPTSFTWELWVYPTNLINSDKVMLSVCETSSPNQCMELMIRQNYTYFGLFGDGCAGRTEITKNRWYHFGFIYDYPNSVQYIYINGVIDCIHNLSVSFFMRNGTITIGAVNNMSNIRNSFWIGYIDHVSYFPYIKTSAEILWDANLVAHYSFDANSYYDDGPNKINGTAVNLTFTPGRVNDAINFNAVGDEFRSGGFTKLGFHQESYSIALWINKAASSGLGGTIAHVSARVNGTGWCTPMIGLSTEDRIVVQSWSGRSVSIVGPIVKPSTWTHIVTTYSMIKGMRLWVDGRLENSTGPFSYLASSTSNWITLGMTPPLASTCARGNISIGQFYGSIDEFMVYSIELQADYISRIANP